MAPRNSEMGVDGEVTKEEEDQDEEMVKEGSTEEERTG